MRKRSVHTAGCRTLFDALGVVARRHPDRIAVVGSGRRITYGELDLEIARLGAGLRRWGVSHGDTVVLLLPSGWEAIRCFFAVVRVGAVAVPLSPRLRLRELRLILDDLRPDLVIAVRRVPGNDLEASVEELCHASSRLTPVVFTEPDPPPWAASLEDLVADQPTSSEVALDPPAPNLAAIFYTTGTTGRPKGVMHTHAGLLASFERMQELQAAFFSGSPVTRMARIASVVWLYGTRVRHGLGTQVWMAPLPWTSMAGFRFSLQALLAGHRLVVMDRFQTTRMLELIQCEEVNILAVAPSMLEVTLKVPDLERHDLSSLLVVGLGAAPTPPDLVRRARAVLRCTVVVGYGATETGGGVLVTGMEDGEREQAETVGRPFPGAEVKIVDERRCELPIGAVGELTCRSPGLMLGYHGQAASTAEAVDDNGWYYTGDLAAMDGRGFVRIVGRKRDLIIRGGYNIVPVEIERVLRNHQAVAQAAVVGVQDRTVGEAIWAFLVLARGAVLHSAEIRNHCVRQLDPGKVPDQFRIVAGLPVGDTGEVRKAALRELARRELRGPAERGPN